MVQNTKINAPALDAVSVSTLPPLTDAIAEVLLRVEQKLAANRPDQAMEVISRSKIGSPWMTNALGVCQMRQGEYDKAVNTFRSMLVGAGGIHLRPEFPVHFKTNFALAMLQDKNLSGFFRVFDEVRDESHPSVLRIQAALNAWKSEFSFIDKLKWWMGEIPSRSMGFDFPLGDLR